MDLMEARRRLMASMAGNALLWKTIILDADRATDEIATPVIWAEYLGISGQTDLDKYVYVVLFSNNTDATYPADLICFTNNKNGNIAYPSVRADWSNVGGTATRSLYASANTRIDIYKLPRHDN
jgi:hypothetical protein